MRIGDLVLVHASGVSTEPRLLSRIDPILNRASIIRRISGTTADLAPFPESENDDVVCDVPTEFLCAVHPDVVPPKDRGRRAVIYLDQCVLSELVKCERGLLDGAGKDAALDLTTALDASVLQCETAICVESWFHRQESSGLATSAKTSNDLFRAAFEFLCLRSRHLLLLEAGELLRNQVLQRVALDTHGIVLPADLLWKTGFCRDPNESNAQTGVLGGRMVVGVPWNLVEPAPELAAGLETDRAAGEFGTFESELAKSVSEWRKEALRGQTQSGWNRYWGGDDYVSNDAVSRYLVSDSFQELPFVRCGTQLTASLLSEKTRRFDNGDYVDIRFVSRALPYCDLMIVDSNLANRVRTLKLDVRYGTKS